MTIILKPTNYNLQSSTADLDLQHSFVYTVERAGSTIITTKSILEGLLSNTSYIYMELRVVCIVILAAGLWLTYTNYYYTYRFKTDTSVIILRPLCNPLWLAVWLIGSQNKISWWHQIYKYIGFIYLEWGFGGLALQDSQHTYTHRSGYLVLGTITTH